MEPVTKNRQKRKEWNVKGKNSSKENFQQKMLKLENELKQLHLDLGMHYIKYFL